MVLQFNSEQSAIESMLRISTAEGLPQSENSDTIYYLDYKVINGKFYIDARNDINKIWYDSELNSCDDVLAELPIINDIDIIN